MRVEEGGHAIHLVSRTTEINSSPAVLLSQSRVCITLSIATRVSEMKMGETKLIEPDWMLTFHYMNKYLTQGHNSCSMLHLTRLIFLKLLYPNFEDLDSS